MGRHNLVQFRKYFSLKKKTNLLAFVVFSIVLFFFISSSFIKSAYMRAIIEAWNHEMVKQIRKKKTFFFDEEWTQREKNEYV